MPPSPETERQVLLSPGCLIAKAHERIAFMMVTCGGVFEGETEVEVMRL